MEITKNNDGIEQAEDILKSFGARIKDGIVYYKEYPPKFYEALNFLVQEWDYMVRTEVMDEWKDVIGYEDIYEVNRAGKVRNKKTGNIMAEYTSGHVYNYVQLNRGGKSVKHYVHRLIALHWIPNPTNRVQVNHKDLDKRNNNIDNLEWVTAKENSVHAAENGVFDPYKEQAAQMHKAKRRRKYAKKLKKEDVLNIRLLFKEGVSKTYIAKKHKISLSYVTSILEGRKYAHYV